MSTYTNDPVTYKNDKTVEAGSYTFEKPEKRPISPDEVPLTVSGSQNDLEALRDLLHFALMTCSKENMKITGEIGSRWLDATNMAIKDQDFDRRHLPFD